MKKKLLIITLSVLIMWGCKKEEKEEVGPQEKPWEVDMLMGNFSINSKDITTNQDGVSLNYLTDNVSPTQLPTSAFQYFTMHAYVPTAKGYSTRIKNIVVEVNTESGYSSDNIYLESDYLGQETFDEQKYDVYSITGEYTGTTAITKTNFANVNFSFSAVYEDDEDDILSTRKVTLEVFKANTDGSTGGTDGGNTGGTDGGNTGGTDGGSTYGNYLFWAAQDFSCGPVTVTVHGEAYDDITNYYTSGTPDCGAAGCANFTLPAGTYTFSAECSSYTWEGTITVTAGTCTKSKLYVN